MNISNLLFVEIETFKLTIMKQFQQIINHTEIKRNAIAKAKEIAGNDIDNAIKLAKKFYSKMIELAMCPRIDCKQLLNTA